MPEETRTDRERPIKANFTNKSKENHKLTFILVGVFNLTKIVQILNVTSN